MYGRRGCALCGKRIWTEILFESSVWVAAGSSASGTADHVRIVYGRCGRHFLLVVYDEEGNLELKVEHEENDFCFWWDRKCAEDQTASADEKRIVWIAWNILQGVLSRRGVGCGIFTKGHPTVCWEKRMVSGFVCGTCGLALTGGCERGDHRTSFRDFYFGT